MTAISPRRRPAGMLRHIVALALVFLAGVTAGSGTEASAAALTVEQAMIRAFEKSERIAEQRNRIAAARSNVTAAEGGSKGTVDLALSGEGRWVRSTNTLNNLSTSGQQTTPRLGLTYSYPLIDAGRRDAVIAEANAELRVEIERLAELTNSIFLEVAETYINVLVAEREKEIRDANVARFETQLEAVTARFNAGDATATDVSQANARLAEARSLVIIAVGRLNDAQIDFEYHTGERLDFAQRPVPNIDIPPNPDDAVARAIPQRPDLRRARAEAEVALQTLRAREAADGLSITLEAGASHAEPLGWDGVRATTLTLSPVLRKNLFDGGAADGQIENARALLESRRAAVDNLIRDAQRRVLSAIEQLITAEARVQSGISQVDASTLALEGVIEAERVGTRSLIDVLNTQRDLADAEIVLLQARSALYLAQARLIAAMGLFELELIEQLANAAPIRPASGGN